MTYFPEIAAAILCANILYRYDPSRRLTVVKLLWLLQMDSIFNDYINLENSSIFGQRNLIAESGKIVQQVTCLPCMHLTWVQSQHSIGSLAVILENTARSKPRAHPGVILPLQNN